MSGKGSKGKGVKRPRSTDADTSSAANGAFAGAVAKTLGKQLPAKVRAEIDCAPVLLAICIRLRRTQSWQSAIQAA